MCDDQNSWKVDIYNFIDLQYVTQNQWTIAAMYEIFEYDVFQWQKNCNNEKFEVRLK